MKKKLISAVMALILTIGTCSVAIAAEKGGATADDLKSHGTIIYESAGEAVEINSADLYMLAEQIDQIRINVTDQLGKINTFFTTGQGTALKNGGRIGITHTRPYGTDYVDPLAIDFDTLVEGIAASQHISSDVKDYGYPAGTKLYQKTDGSLTTDRGSENLPELFIKPATPENLSAGTAAWVKGKLILGTGTDNQTYMKKGESSVPSGDIGGTGNTVDLSNVFLNFNKVGGWMAGFEGVIPYTFTPGKSLLLVLDGPLDATFDGTNLPDSAVTGQFFSMFYWQNNPHSSIKLEVEEAYGGYNDVLLVKEW